MTYRGIAEIVLHLEHFRNVDLFQQGIYFLKFQVYNEDQDKVTHIGIYHCDFVSYSMRILMTMCQKTMKAGKRRKSVFIGYKSLKLMMRLPPT